jgi:hypothetical protein
MKYKFIKEYFIDNDSDVVEIGKHKFSVDINSENKLSQKVLGWLYALKKGYVTIEGEEVVKKVKSKPIKKKKIKIDEPKKEEQPITNPESNEEES